MAEYQAKHGSKVDFGGKTVVCMIGVGRARVFEDVIANPFHFRTRTGRNFADNGGWGGEEMQ